MRKILGIIVIILLFSLLPARGTLAQSSAQVGTFDAYQLAPGGRVEVPIEIRGVVDLYAIDIELSFDPAMLGAEDADPSMDGIQPALGTFLDAGLLLYNSIDLETGIIRFAMSQVNPSEAKSGDGILLVVYFVGKAAGESFLTVNSVTLSDRLGNEIPSTGVGAAITVVEDAPAVTSTSIPVQNPTSIIVIPTLGPTATPTPVPTETPVPTQTPVPTSTQKAAVAEAEPTDMDDQNGAGESEDEDGFSLRQNWWIIALVALLAGAGSVVVTQFKRKSAKVSEEKPSTPPENE